MEVSYEVMEAYIEKYDRALCDIWELAKKATEKDRYPWTTLPLPRMKKIWRDYAKLGFVRDEIGVSVIADEVVEMIAKLDVMTMLLGHTSESPKSAIEDKELEYDAATEERLSSYLYDDEQNQWRLSDYGLPKLQELAAKILSTRVPEEKLLLIDQVLNVAHQRSDLASWFVEGGRRALEELSNQEV